MARWPIKRNEVYQQWTRWWAWHKVKCEGLWVRWEWIEREYHYSFDIDGSGYHWYEYRFPKQEWQGEY